MKDLGMALIYVGVILIFLALGIAGWYAKRYVNDWLYYDGATKEVVCEMVKPEYLKEGACE
jgi:hypothetical protein